jgi:cysteine synthase A
MTIAQDTLALIGNTPMVRLAGPSEASGAEIFGKCEFANPGASVKDRAALYIVKDAEEKGLLQPGGTIVEGTAGNTGIGLALVANAKGYKTIIVMPETQSREKMDTLRALGAELVLVPAAPFPIPAISCTLRAGSPRRRPARSGPTSSTTSPTARRISRHAEEIWAQMEGRIDGFTCSGGHRAARLRASGSASSKERGRDHRAQRPHGAALYNYYANGELKAEGSSVAEGIGQGRITANLEGAPIDTQFRISDADGMVWVERLLAEEGLCLGLSSGINVAGAIELGRATRAGQPHRHDAVRHRPALSLDSL